MREACVVAPVESLLLLLLMLFDDDDDGGGGGGGMPTREWTSGSV